jgi:hypothetical protein
MSAHSITLANGVPSGCAYPEQCVKSSTTWRKHRSQDKWHRLPACELQIDRLEAYPTTEIRHLFLERCLASSLRRKGVGQLEAYPTF